MTNSRMLSWSAADIGVLEANHVTHEAAPALAAHLASILPEAVSLHPATLHADPADGASVTDNFDFALPASTHAYAPAISSIGDGSEDVTDMWRPAHQATHATTDDASSSHGAAAADIHSSAPVAHAIHDDAATTIDSSTTDTFSTPEQAMQLRGMPTSPLTDNDIQDIVNQTGMAAASDAQQSSGGGITSSTTMNGKNILMFAVDDMSAFVTLKSLYPGVIQTPNIDRLMAMGTTFTNAFATTALCNPSRTAILSGELPTSTGVFDNVPTWYNTVNPSTTLFGLMQTAGFDTVGGGKLFHNQSFPDNVTSQMFSSFFTPNAVPGVQSISQTGFNFQPYTGDPNDLHDSQMSAWASNFLETYDSSTPFFLSVGMDGTHAPWLIPQSYYDMYDPSTLPLVDHEDDDMDDIPEFMLSRKFPTGPHELATATWEKALQSYFAAITYDDEQIGKVLDSMTQAQLNNTAIVLWSDHGLHMGDKDVFGKFTLWDDDTRVPFVVVDPGVTTGGTVVSTTVSTLDILPTVLDIAGVAPSPDAEGTSLLPLLEDPSDTSFSEPAFTFMYGSWSIRTDDYRYIHYEDGSEELYAVQTDPHDFTNLASDPDYASIKAGLLQLGVTDLAQKGWLQGTDPNATEMDGTSGNDTMTSPSANVVYHGGAGNDTYFLWTDTQSIVEAPNAGTDTVFLYFADFTTPDNVENVNTEAFSGAAPNFHILGNASDNVIIAQDGNDVLTGLGGNDTLNGFWGDDILNGGDGDDDLIGQIGNDMMIGGAGNNTINGGQGIDTVDYSEAPGAININMTAVANQVHNQNGYGGVDTLLAMENVIGTPFNDVILGNGDDNVFTGGAGDDNLNGGVGNDTLIAGTGNDVLIGGVGDDTFQMDGNLTAADSINGGDGNDVVELNGDYSAGVTFLATTMKFVEKITLGAGFSYSLSLVDGNVAAGATLTIDGSKLGATDSLTFNGFHELDGSYVILGGAGNDNITAGQMADTIDTGTGGTDIVNAEAGDDVITMGAGLDASDNIDGGAGNDRVILDGDYSAGVVFGNTTMLNVERLVLTAGFSYNLTLANSTVTAGTTFIVNAGTLGATDTLIFSGQHESDGQFTITAGAGNDTITGGAGNDTFVMSMGGEDTVLGGAGNDTFQFGGAFDQGDSINGGTGKNTLVLNGDYSAGVIMGPHTLTSVGTIFLTTGHSYSLTSTDSTVAAGATMTIQATGLGAGDVLTFDGSRETDGHFIIYGGAGDDFVTGGALGDTFDMQHGGIDSVSGGGGDDVINLGDTLTSTSRIDGGTGTDTVTLSGEYSTAVLLGAHTLTNVEILKLGPGFDYRLTTTDATVAAGQTLTVAATGLATGHSLVFDGSAETDGRFIFETGASNDTLFGGAGNDVFKLAAGGADHAHGGGGDDTFVMGAAFGTATQIDGGDGNDSVTLSGDYTNLVFRATSLTSVETLNFGAGHSYHITTNDANVAAGAILKAYGGSLGANDTLFFNGTAETDGRLFITGGAGNDTLIGGSGADIIHAGNGVNIITGGLGGDVLQGGTGADTFTYHGATDSTGTTYDSILGFDAAMDKFDLPGTHAVAAVDAAVTTGALSYATFNQQLQTEFSTLAAHHAVLFTADSGNLAGNTYLIIDANGTPGYQAGSDYIIHLETPANLADLTVSSFI